MAYSNDPGDYKEEELLRVAELHYVERLSHRAIGERLLLRPRARVVAMCEAARRAGLVHIAVMPSRSSEGSRLRDIAARVREKFNLLDAIVVHGRSEMLEGALPDSVREVIMDDVARFGAEQVDRRYCEQKPACLAVTYGFVTRKIADYLRPSSGVDRNGLVIAAQGMRRLELDRFDANNIVRDIARQFGCRYACMPIPAVVDARDTRVVSNLPLVRQVLYALEHDTNVVITSLASHQQTDWRPRQDSLQNDLVNDTDMTGLTNAGGIANVGGWWFDAQGEPVQYKARSVVGLGLDRMKQLVHDRKPVMLAVGADPTRIPGLIVALSCKKPIANVWIGDEVTARVLLGERQLDMRQPSWREDEREILRSVQ